MSSNTGKWYMKFTGYDDVIMSAKVRLSRNLAEFDFKERLSNEDAARLVEKVRTLTPLLAGREGMEYYSCNVNKLPELERRSLIELQEISPMLSSKPQPTGLIISEDESVSIMINEEDHIRIRAAAAGNNMQEVYRIASRIDDFIDSEFEYAYSDKYGYLTTSLSNTGTGLRAAYTMSLPALTMSGRIGAIRDEINKFGVAIRGVYGEDNKGDGFMYQVSNQKTIGAAEQDILDNLEQIVGQIVSLERKQRSVLIESRREELEDKVYRSYGVLKYTRTITAKDAMMLLAQLKLGSDTGLIKLSYNGNEIHRLMLEIQPAWLEKLYKCGSDEAAINRARAQHINSKMPTLY